MTCSTPESGNRNGRKWKIWQLTNATQPPLLKLCCICSADGVHWRWWKVNIYLLFDEPTGTRVDFPCQDNLSPFWHWLIAIGGRLPFDINGPPLMAFGWSFLFDLPNNHWNANELTHNLGISISLQWRFKNIATLDSVLFLISVLTTTFQKEIKIDGNFTPTWRGLIEANHTAPPSI